MASSAYDEVLDISYSIVNASEIGDTRAKWAAYEQLQAVCERYESTQHDHPLQWEALADFTPDDQASLQAYEKGLALATKLVLPEYEASIYLAMAERQLALVNVEEAKSLAHRAQEASSATDDMELRREISDFLAGQNADT